jgi:WhiB family redox-sensing transcriptional regulator
MGTRRRTGPLTADIGLCSYEDPEIFHKQTISQAARICGNCPVIVACGESAIKLGVTEGVFAGIKLPGEHYDGTLEKAYADIAAVIEQRRHDPPAVRRQKELIRAAAHYAATLPAGALDDVLDNHHGTDAQRRQALSRRAAQFVPDLPGQASA